MTNKSQSKPAAASASKEPPAEVSPGWVGILRGLLVTVVLLAVIAWATVFFALRSDVGRDAVRSRIETKTGMLCELGQASLVFPCVLRLRDVQLREPDAEHVSVGIARLDIRGGFNRGLRFELSEPSLTIRQAEDGVWLPERLAILSAALDRDVYLIGTAVRSLGAHHRMTLEDGRIQWIYADGQMGAEVQNLDFRSQPVRIPNQLLQYNELRYERAGDSGLETVGRRAWAWLSADAIDYIEVPLAP